MTAIPSTCLKINSSPKAKPLKNSIDMKRVAAIILGGGQGTRLFPLTTNYCKPAACIGGKYRLIDIPISNAINSGCSKIYIITQFLSNSLHQHILRTYQLGPFTSGFLELLPAEQRSDSNPSWFQGPADAVRKNLDFFIETPVDYFLILSGDQLYNMNFQHMLQFAQESGNELTIAALPVDEVEAKRMGLLKVNDDHVITDFYEKPQTREALDQMRLSELLARQNGGKIQHNQHYLGSMGIYLFKRSALLDLLHQDPREDFGKHLIPTMVKQKKASAYQFEGYWVDVGTIDSYYRANMELAKPSPGLECYNETNPIFSQPYHLPPPKIIRTQVEHSLICEGSIIAADAITNSLLGPRTVVNEGTIIRNSYVIGNDFYSPPMHSGKYPNVLEIGRNCIIDRAILDKHVSIGNGVQLVNKNKLTHYDSDHIYIRDGIIVVTNGAVIPDGFIL